MERFFSRLQGLGLWNVEDELVLVGAKDGNFSVRQLYKEMEPRRQVDFPFKALWKIVPLQRWCFSLGRQLGAEF